MDSTKSTVARRWRTLVVLGLVLILALALLPYSVLAYDNPLAGKNPGRLWQSPKHSAPASLDVGEETDEPPAVGDDDDGDADDVDDGDVDDGDADDPTEPITGTVGITASVTVRGPISQLPADGVVGEWVIAGQAVEVTATTHLSGRAQRAEVGDWATARAQRQADGGLVAWSVTVMHANHLVRVVGKIDKFGDGSWVIAGVTVSVTQQTHIVGTPEVGLVADAHGTMSEDGAFMARSIHVRGTRNQGKVNGVPWGKAKRLTPTPTPGSTPEALQGSAPRGGPKVKPNKPRGKGR